MNQSRPYYMTDEMYARLRDIFDSHPTDLEAVADTIYREFPGELDRRAAGFAAIWAKKEFSKHIVYIETPERIQVDGPWFEAQERLDYEATLTAFEQGAGRV